MIISHATRALINQKEKYVRFAAIFIIDVSVIHY